MADRAGTSSMASVDLLTRPEPTAAAPPPSRAARRIGRGPVSLVLIAEAAAAAAWAVIAQTMEGDRLRVAVGLVAVALVVARVVAGGLRDGGRGAVGWLLVAACRVAMVA